MCDLPPCPPCPPPSPAVCQQVCPDPPPLPPCRAKPIMRRLHWAQTEAHLARGFTLCFIVGALGFVFVKRARMEKYRDFYAKAEMEDWADEMARKGLFQSVPPDSLRDNVKK